MLLPLPDRAPAPSTVDVRTALCSQSSALHAVSLRLEAAGAELSPPGTDGWRGVAELAHSAAVRHAESVMHSARITIDSAQQLTDAAIWMMTDVG